MGLNLRTRTESYTNLVILGEKNREKTGEKKQERKQGKKIRNRIKMKYKMRNKHESFSVAAG